MYNLTGIGDNTTGLLTFVQGVNHHLMFDWLGIMLLIALSIITFMAFMVTIGEIKRSVMATAFISFIFSIFLKMMGLIPDIAMFIALIVVAFAVGFSFIGEKD